MAVCLLAPQPATATGEIEDGKLLIDGQWTFLKTGCPLANFAVEDLKGTVDVLKTKGYNNVKINLYWDHFDTNCDGQLDNSLDKLNSLINHIADIGIYCDLSFETYNVGGGGVAPAFFDAHPGAQAVNSDGELAFDGEYGTGKKIPSIFHPAYLDASRTFIKNVLEGVDTSKILYFETTVEPQYIGNQELDFSPAAKTAWEQFCAQEGIASCPWPPANHPRWQEFRAKALAAWIMDDAAAIREVAGPDALIAVDYLETGGGEMENRNGDSLIFLGQLQGVDILQCNWHWLPGSNDPFNLTYDRANSLQGEKGWAVTEHMTINGNDFMAADIGSVLQHTLDKGNKFGWEIVTTRNQTSNAFSVYNDDWSPKQTVAELDNNQAYWISKAYGGTGEGWDAAFMGQSYPHFMEPGEVIAVHLQYKNIGGMAWDPELTRLGTTEPQDGESPFYDPDTWLGPNRAAAVDAPAPPGQIGTFSFTLRAPEVTEPTEFIQHWGLVQEGVTWFGPPQDQVWFKVLVSAECPDNNCGACGPDVEGLGEPCGDCGKFVCSNSGLDKSCDDPGFNQCGVCGPDLPDTGASCTDRNGETGQWVCAGDGWTLECQAGPIVEEGFPDIVTADSTKFQDAEVEEQEEETAQGELLPGNDGTSGDSKPEAGDELSTSGGSGSGGGCSSGRLPARPDFIILLLALMLLLPLVMRRAYLLPLLLLAAAACGGKGSGSAEDLAAAKDLTVEVTVDVEQDLPSVELVPETVLQDSAADLVEVPEPFTRPEKGEPLSDAEVAEMTEKYIELLQGTRYFEVTAERLHGWPESDPQGRYWYGTWWSGVKVQKEDGKVTYLHGSDGADNNGMRTGPLLSGACFAQNIWGNKVPLVQEMVRGFNSWAMAMERDSMPEQEVLLARAHYPESVTSVEGGIEYYIDYSLNRPGEDGFEKWDDPPSYYVHNPDNPHWGDIWVKNKRSKDDVGHMLLALAFLPSCTTQPDQGMAADLEYLEQAYGEWCRRVEADDWHIATVDKEWKEFFPEGDLAVFVDVPNIDMECKGMLAVRLFGHGDPGSLECGNGVGYFGEEWGLKNAFHQIQRSFHEAAAALAFGRGYHELGNEMVSGLAWRLDKIFDAHEAGTPPENPGNEDLAELVVMAASVGVPLTWREVRFLHDRISDAHASYLAEGNMPTYHVFDADTPDGVYPFNPGGSGFFWRYLAAPLGLCGSPYRNPTSKPALNCEQIKGAGL